jgi:hypothetical protein
MSFQPPLLVDRSFTNIKLHSFEGQLTGAASS